MARENTLARSVIGNATVADGTGAPRGAADVVLESGGTHSIGEPGTHAGEVGATNATGTGPEPPDSSTRTPIGIFSCF